MGLVGGPGVFWGRPGKGRALPAFARPSVGNEKWASLASFRKRLQQGVVDPKTPPRHASPRGGPCSLSLSHTLLREPGGGGVSSQNIEHREEEDEGEEEEEAVCGRCMCACVGCLSGCRQIQPDRHARL